MNQSSLFQAMQTAVDAIPGSEHPSSKVAATISGTDHDGKTFQINAVNEWPEAIKNHFPTDQKIGNSSGTIHAETACILKAPKTEKASLFITDPPCPNCMKNMAEAGIQNLYLDHKGFTKDFAARRGHYFKTMSVNIAQKAGINIFKINRKAESVTSIIEIPRNYKPFHENPPILETLQDINQNATVKTFITQQSGHYGNIPYAACIAESAEKTVLISAQPHATIGYSQSTIGKCHEKYSYILEPVNRLIMIAARYGLKISPSYLYSSRTPTSRELVNMIGAGLSDIIIYDETKARDHEALNALKQLQSHKIMNIKHLDDL